VPGVTRYIYTGWGSLSFLLLFSYRGYGPLAARPLFRDREHAIHATRTSFSASCPPSFMRLSSASFTNKTHWLFSRVSRVSNFLGVASETSSKIHLGHRPSVRKLYAAISLQRRDWVIKSRDAWRMQHTDSRNYWSRLTLTLISIPRAWMRVVLISWPWSRTLGNLWDWPPIAVFIAFSRTAMSTSSPCSPLAALQTDEGADYEPSPGH